MAKMLAASLMVVPVLLGACLAGSEETPNPAEPPSSSAPITAATTTAAPDAASPAPALSPTSTAAADTTPTTTTIAVTTTTKETTTSTSPPLTATTTTTTTNSPHHNHYHNSPGPNYNPPHHHDNRPHHNHHNHTLPTPAPTTTTTTHDPGPGPVTAEAVHEVSVSTVEFMPGLYADVHAPTQPGDYPVVTLTFGRGWSIGDRSQLSALAHYLASRGVVAVNGEHRTLLRLGRFSSMAGEVACLAAAAPHLAADHLSGSAPPVWLLGYSSGAHLAALATLTDRPLPPRCPHAPGQIAGMIGLGGPYDLDDLWNGGIPDYFFDSEDLADLFPALASVVQRGDLMAMQLYLRVLTGASPDEAEEWAGINPLDLAHRYPERSFLLVTGDEDEVVYPFHSERFADALQAGGHYVSLEVIPHTDHMALTHPENVGDVIRTFVERAP